MTGKVVQPDPEKLRQASAWYWANFNKIQLPDGPYSHDGHEFMKEVLDDQSQRQCAMKAPQFAGYTVAYILRSVHEMIYGWLSKGVLYMLPTRDEVSDFSDSKFRPIVEENPKHIGRFVKNTDRTNLKKIGKAFIYFRGANLTQKTEAAELKGSKIKSISVDQIVMDEYDEMPKEARALALGRMEASTVQRELYLANPTFPGYGIDQLFYEESDQRYWELFCPACGKWTNMELTFPDCLKRQKDGSVIRACIHCGKEISPRNGKWVPQYPNKSKDMVGRRISHLASAFKNPKAILDAWEDPEKMKLYYENKTMFMRHCLATGYVEAENALTKEDVFRCCGQEINGTVPRIGAFLTPRPCAMGVDVKKVLNVVVGFPVFGKDVFEVVYVTRVEHFSELHDIAKKYNVKSCVIDAEPETRKARDFQRAEPYKVMLCDYQERLKTGQNIDDNAGMMTVRRTELCDKTHELVKTPGRLILPRRGQEVDEFAVQCTRIVKRLVEDKETGIQTYKYKKLHKDDDYRHALNYFYLACQDPNLQLMSSNVGRRIRPKKQKVYDPFSVLDSQAA